MPEKPYKLNTTVHSDKEHPPISFSCQVPQELALLLMATPVVSVTLSVEATPGMIVDRTKLLDFR